MNSVVIHFPIFFRKSGIIMAFVALLFACSKTKDTPAGSAVKYCKSIDWENTNGETGNFSGTLSNGHYNLTSVTYSQDANHTAYASFNYDASGHLINQNGITYTYNQDNLDKFVVDLSTISKASGTATYTFDNNSHLTNLSINGTNENGPLTTTVNYTYDSNDDPVKIVGHGTLITSSGPSTTDYTITADYLTDKGSFVPVVPIVAPFTAYFAYANFISKHLINKWTIKIITTVPGMNIPEIDYTYQYTYTYDSNGMVSTMVHSGNPNNKYTFTYSGCN